MIAIAEAAVSDNACDDELDIFTVFPAKAGIRGQATCR